MKKIRRLLTLFLLCFLFASASAEETVEIETASSYCMDGELYSFFSIDEQVNPESFGVVIHESEIYVDKSQTSFKRLKDTDAVIHYIYLIDESKSIRKYIDSIKAMMKSIEENEKSKADYSVVFFGDQFRVEAEGLNSANEAAKVIEASKFDQNYTDHYMALNNVIDRIENKGLNKGDIYSIIMITDGETDVNKKLEKRSVAELATELDARLEKTTYITISSVCTNKWSKEISDVIKKGIGRHLFMENTDEAIRCGVDLTSYYDNLCRLKLNIKRNEEAPTFFIKMLLEGGDIINPIIYDLTLENVKDFSYTDGENEPTKLPDDIPVEPEVTTEPEPTEDPKPTEDPELPIIESSSEEHEPESGKASDENEVNDSEKSEKDDSDDNKTIIIIASCAVAAVLLLAIIIIIVSKKKKKPESVGIKMLLEVYEGKCMNKTNVVYLDSVLTVGSSKEANIVFYDNTIEAIHANILFMNGKVYIKDVSHNGVLLGGMKINDTNVLRSGDIVTIGHSSFALKFPV